MKLVVMKFGGTSVGDLDKIANVAKIINQEVKKNKLIVVLSAMAGETNKLQNYLDIIKSDNQIENDLVLTSGKNKIYSFVRLANPYNYRQ